jgi:hypothetical protein
MRFGDEPRDIVEEACLQLMQWAFASDDKPEMRAVTLARNECLDLFLAYRGQDSV